MPGFLPSLLNLSPVSSLHVPESLYLKHQIEVLCCCFPVNACTLIANRSDHGQAVGRQGAFILGSSVSGTSGILTEKSEYNLS